MVKNLKKDLEQLEVSNIILKEQTDTRARLALLLLDNLAEILMYRYVSSVFTQDGMYDLTSSLKFSAEERIAVLSYFEEKLKFLRKNDVIDDDTKVILKIVHELRNEAYHLDILKENVLIPIVKSHYQIICKLIPVLSETGYGSVEVSNFLKAHGISEMLITVEVLEKLASEYSSLNPCPISDFVQNLSNDLIQRIKDTEDNIDYLMKGSNFTDEDHLLKDLQFWDMGISKEERDLTKINELLNRFKPNIKFKTLTKWKNRSRKILKAENHAKALQTWSEIDSVLSRIEIMIIESIHYYEEHADLQLEEMKLRS